MAFLPIVKKPEIEVEWEEEELYQTDSKKNFEKNGKQLEKIKSNLTIYQSITTSKMKELKTIQAYKLKTVRVYLYWKHKIDNLIKAREEIVTSYRIDMIHATLKGTSLPEMKKKKGTGNAWEKRETLAAYLGNPNIPHIYKNIKEYGKSELTELKEKFQEKQWQQIDRMAKVEEMMGDKGKQIEEDFEEEIQILYSKAHEYITEIQKNRILVEEEMKNHVRPVEKQKVIDLDMFKAIMDLNEAQKKLKPIMYEIQKLYEHMEKHCCHAKTGYTNLVNMKPAIEALAKELAEADIVRDIETLQVANHAESILKAIIQERLRREMAIVKEKKEREIFLTTPQQWVKEDPAIIDFKVTLAPAIEKLYQYLYDDNVEAICS